MGHRRLRAGPPAGWSGQLGWPAGASEPRRADRPREGGHLRLTVGHRRIGVVQLRRGRGAPTRRASRRARRPRAGGRASSCARRRRPCAGGSGRRWRCAAWPSPSGRGSASRRTVAPPGEPVQRSVMVPRLVPGLCPRACCRPPSRVGRHRGGSTLEPMQNDDVWLVVPLYNEAAVIADVVREARPSSPTSSASTTARSDAWPTAPSSRARAVVRHPVNLGQGAALQTGFELRLGDPGDALRRHLRRRRPAPGPRRPGMLERMRGGGPATSSSAPASSTSAPTPPPRSGSSCAPPWATRTSPPAPG